MFFSYALIQNVCPWCEQVLVCLQECLYVMAIQSALLFQRNLLILTYGLLAALLDLLHNGIHSRACLHHHQNAPRTLELPNEILQIGSALDLLALTTAAEEVLRFGVGAVVDDARKTVALSVKDEIFAHYTEANQTEVGFVGHGPGHH